MVIESARRNNINIDLAKVSEEKELLFSAVLRGNVGLVRTLLTYNACPLIESKKAGILPLHAAAG